MRVNVLSGVVSTLFMIAAVNLSTGSNASTFTVVLYLATSTTLLSYLLIFPAALKLRYSHPHIERPYRVPGGMPGMWIMVVLTTGWMVLGSWVALFPGTLDRAVREAATASHDTYGVSRIRFEVFTLGTLAVVVVIGLLGYIAGAGVRAQTVRSSVAHRRSLTEPAVAAS